MKLRLINFRHFALLCVSVLLLSIFWRIYHTASQRQVSEKNTFLRASKQFNAEERVEDHAPTSGSAGERTETTAAYLGTSNTTEELVRMASAIAQKRALVLFSVVNDAYVDLAASWLCNTAVLHGVHQHVLLLATDVTTGQRLRNKWPEISVVAMNSSDFSGPQQYSRAGYVRLMVERTRYIQAMVQAGVRMLLFETDFVWLSDPLPTIISESNRSGADIIGSRVYGQDKVCGCLLLLNRTPRTSRVWTRLTEQMDQLYHQVSGKSGMAAVSEGTNDQTFLSTLLNKKYNGVRVTYLSEELFPDGKWYSMDKLKSHRPKPLIIHNNWIEGNAAKIERAKEFGHWFLSNTSKGSGFTCNTTALHDLTAQ